MIPLRLAALAQGDRVVALALAALAGGCLGPLVSDQPGPTGDVLPAGSVVPTVEQADPEDAEAIAANDGVDGLVPRQTAFSEGQVVHVWDFGPAPALAAPIFSLVREDGNGYTRLPHPTIVGSIPGDAGYSPFWAVYYVVVTDKYQGELITSLDGLAEAERRGLVEHPEAQLVARNCPIVGGDVTVDVGTGTPRTPNGLAYYEGFSVPYFDFGVMPLVDGVRIPTATRYLLRRAGEEPLNELVRGVDIDGDGDALDTNDVYSQPPGQPTSSPLVATTAVAVVGTTASIDTSGDEGVADLTRASQMFAPAPVPGVVVGFQAGTELRNVAGQRQAGGL